MAALHQPVGSTGPAPTAVGFPKYRHLRQPSTASALAEGEHSAQPASAPQRVLVTVKLHQVSSSAKGLYPSRLSAWLLSQENLLLQGQAGERRVTLI